jgi:hypothetical protein
MVHGSLPTGTLTCLAADSKITFKGMTVALPAGTFVGLQVSITNPTYSYTPGKFIIETLRKDTQYVYDQRYINGILVEPGPITDISLLALDSSITIVKRKDMWLKLSFKPKNSIPAGGKIILTFPSLFSIVVSEF